MSIGEATLGYLPDRGWSFVKRGDILVATAGGDHGSWPMVFDIREDDDQLLVYSILPVDVPPERRPTAALYLTQANFGLGIGNFELDLDDGEVRFKTSVDVEGVEMVDHLVLANIVITDKYLPGLTAVVDGGEPEAAIAATENRGVD